MKVSSFLWDLIVLLLVPLGTSLAQGTYWEQTGGPPGGFTFAIGIDSSNRIFAGTEGDGIYRSTNDGGLWTSTSIDARRILAIVVAPNGHILAGGDGGIYRTTDGGETWTSRGLTMFGIEALAVSPGGTLLAGTGGGVYRSTNEGTNWTYTGLFLQAGAHSLLFRSEDIAFAGAWADPYYALYRSTDGGETWTGSVLSSNNFIGALALQSNGGILAGTVGGIYRSTDNGDNWDHLGLDSLQVLSITMNSLGHLFAGTGIGVSISRDDGVSWEQISSGLSNLTVFSLAVSTVGFIFAGNGDGVARSIGTTSMDANNDELPLRFFLYPNYPNPFNPVTTIRFDLPATSSSEGQAGIRDVGFVSLKVYDLLGREVATLVNEKLGPGTYTRQWDAGGMASGVYYYRLKAGGFVETKKLVLLR